MIFNDVWTKEVNDLYRQMIKEKKSRNEIKELLGDKMDHHPNGKFKYGGGRLNIKNYKEFINEVIYTPLHTDYNITTRVSNFLNTEKDYVFNFKTNSNTDYILEFMYYQDTIGPCINRNLYNISFTTKEQYDEFVTTNNYQDYEKETDKKEYNELMKRCIYLFSEFHNNFGKHRYAVYVIGETEKKIKIDFYVKLITDSLPFVTKINGLSSINLGKNVWYFIP